MLRAWADIGQKTARYSNFWVVRLKIRESSPPLSATKLRPCVKHCKLDLLPTWLILECIDEFLSIIIDIVNISMTTGEMPHKQRHDYNMAEFGGSFAQIGRFCF